MTWKIVNYILSIMTIVITYKNYKEQEHEISIISRKKQTFREQEWPSFCFMVDS